jgi:putative transcriptional regulator
VKWNLRLVAAQRDIWKSSELQRMLADAGLVISAGKMSNLWAGRPVTIRLDDLEIICSVLDCTPNDLLIPEPAQQQVGPPADEQSRKAVGEQPGAIRRASGRTRPPL